MSTMEERIIFSENLQRLMDERGKTRNDISFETGIKYPTICEWLNKRKYPRIDKIQLLADYFGVGKTDLIDKRNSITPSKAHRIPVYGKVAAGIPLEMVEDIIDYEEIPAKWGDPSDFFCLQIKGSSMRPKIDDGDVVVVKKQEDAETGNIVIASINGEEATCKKLRKTENGIFLMPTNNDYEPMFYSNEDIKSLPVHILGRVVELRAKF